LIIRHCSPDLSARGWEAGTDDRPDRVQPVPVRRRALDDEHHAEDSRPPAESLLDDGPSEPALHVKVALRLLVGLHDGLELDDTGGSVGGARREQVDRASVSVTLECHLGQDVPPHGDQIGSHARPEPRVPLVHQSLALPSTPSDLELSTGVQAGEHRPDHPQRELIDVAALETRDRGLGNASHVSQVVLSQAPPPSRGR